MKPSPPVMPSSPPVMPSSPPVSEKDAEDAVRVLLRFTGDDPAREGLQDTPKRVVQAFKEYFKGYREQPEDYLNRFFCETENYKDMVLLRNITFASHCEHHMAPMTGVVHIAYLPDKRVVGISKLVRLTEMFARRLQIQEKFTAQISNTLVKALQPRGTAVFVEAVHHCMTTRGVGQANVVMVTSRYSGAFACESDRALQNEFLRAIGK